MAHLFELLLEAEVVLNLLLGVVVADALAGLAEKILAWVGWWWC